MRRFTSRIFPDMPLRNVIPLQRHRPMSLLKDLPNFGLAFGGILIVLIFIHMTFGPRPSRGLLMKFIEQDTVLVEKSPFTETMAVYVDVKRTFYVNGKVVAREELGEEVEKELARRGVWVVYFEADCGSLYMDAIYAIDTIQGLGASVIWITPGTRENWKKRVVPQRPPPAQ